jgi:hypothetical protein
VTVSAQRRTDRRASPAPAAIAGVLGGIEAGDDSGWRWAAVLTGWLAPRVPDLLHRFA